MIAILVHVTGSTYNVKKMDNTAYFFNLVFVWLSGIGTCPDVQCVSITFRETPFRYEIFEGNKAELICQQERQGSLSIGRANNAIVEDLVLVGSQFKYSFNKERPGNQYILTIKKVDKNDSGNYFCVEDATLITQLHLEILYPPKTGPYCTSSYGTSKSYFDDIAQPKFFFNCTVEDGNPPIKFQLYKEGEHVERITYDRIIAVQRPGQTPLKTLLFSSYLDSSFNNSCLTCHVNQDVSPAIMEYNFNETCSFGPMRLLPSFDISLTPANVSFREGDATVLTCSSNVSTVVKRWMNIPKGVVHETAENASGLHLTVFDVEAINNHSITVGCECLFGNRRLSAKATINILRNDSTSTDRPKFLVGALILGIALLVSVGIIIFYRRIYRHNLTCRSDYQEDNHKRGEEEQEETEEGEMVVYNLRDVSQTSETGIGHSKMTKMNHNNIRGMLSEVR